MEEGGIKKTKRVQVSGLAPSGYLMAVDLGDGVRQNTKGHVYELHPDGNSLDFMKGFCVLFGSLLLTLKIHFFSLRLDNSKTFIMTRCRWQVEKDTIIRAPANID